MSVLAVIPARAGSVGLPGKNIRLLAGRPLITHSIAAARAARHVTRTVVSTDSPEYARIAVEAGAETPFLRDAGLSGPDVFSVEVVRDTLRRLDTTEGYVPDLVVMLLPTSPLRTAASIDRGIALFLEHQPDSVVSVCESAKQDVHFRRIVDGRLQPLPHVTSLNVQRQDTQPLYVVNGSIYVATPATIRAHGSFHLPDARALVMSAAESVDINGPEDFAYAEWLMARQGGEQ